MYIMYIEHCITITSIDLKQHNPGQNEPNKTEQIQNSAFRHI